MTELKVVVDKFHDQWQVRLVINDCCWDVGDPYDNTKEDYDDAEAFASELESELIEWKER